MSSTPIARAARRPVTRWGVGRRLLWAAVLLAGVGGGTALLAADAAAAVQGPASARHAHERTHDSTDAFALLPLGGGVAAFGTASVLVLRRLDLSDAE
ncbi:hypothetical protein [Cryobacterium arcticum]|uniref:Uncharacterized protein n=1 Tax=Cryobacterium arcticum TaxID=670052 RepID=A0A1B1BG42_9MICO|nr:hypothetical protein [Cryobacterium arcticum]ANP71555.1 hypothetical protein PA27867_0586 [Cryobacterium arcticum]